MADDPDHCGADYVEIIDMKLKKTQARFCGNQVPGDIVSQGRILRIDFQGQQGCHPDKGFAISYTMTTARSGFYTSKSFDPDAPRTTTTRPRLSTELSTIADDNSSNSQVGLYIGLGLGCLAIIIIGFLVWRRLEVLKKRKRKEKESTLSTRSTDQDPRLPQNEIDPFERIASVCSHVPPSIIDDISIPGSNYINCQPPPLPKSNNPNYRNTSYPPSEASLFDRRSTGVKSSRSRTSDVFSQSQCSELPRSPSRSGPPPLPERRGFQPRMEKLHEHDEGRDHLMRTRTRSLTRDEQSQRKIVPDVTSPQLERTTSRRGFDRRASLPSRHHVRGSSSDFSREMSRVSTDGSFKRLSDNPPSRRSRRATIEPRNNHHYRRHRRFPRSHSNDAFKARM
ncbi:uncharacterized protein LOC100180211 [Ciona intestinalis]